MGNPPAKNANMGSQQHFQRFLRFPLYLSEMETGSGSFLSKSFEWNAPCGGMRNGGAHLPPLPPAAAPASPAATSAALVPGQDCMMLTISPRRFHSSQRGGRVGCKITLVPYNLQYVPFVNMPNTLGNALPLQSPPLQQQPLSAHADLGSSRSPLELIPRH